MSLRQTLERRKGILLRGIDAANRVRDDLREQMEASLAAQHEDEAELAEIEKVLATLLADPE